jgi:WD40 repeat protein
MINIISCYRLRAICGLDLNRSTSCQEIPVSLILMKPKTFKIITLLSVAISIAAVIPVMQSQGSKDQEQQPPDNKFDLVIESGEIHESCLKILKTEILKYSFQSSGKLDFNIHYHDEANEDVFYPVEETLISAKTGTFLPEVGQTYCMMWENKGESPSGLAFQSRVLPGAVAESEKIPVTFQADTVKNTIRVLDSEAKPVFLIEVGSPILEFTLNHSSNLLAVVTSSSNLLKIYDLESREWQQEVKYPSALRFLVFSNDDKTLALADEHSAEVIFLNTTDYEIDTRLGLPEPPVAMLSGENPDQLLVRTKKNILNIDFEERKILQRNAKIPIDFGGEKVLIDPKEWCFSHGVPHPLYAATSQAMNIGLSGHISLPSQPGS